MRLRISSSRSVNTCQWNQWSIGGQLLKAQFIYKNRLQLNNPLGQTSVLKYYLAIYQVEMAPMKWRITSLLFIGQGRPLQKLSFQRTSTFRLIYRAKINKGLRQHPHSITWDQAVRMDSKNLNYLCNTSHLIMGNSRNNVKPKYRIYQYQCNKGIEDITLWRL